MDNNSILKILTDRAKAKGTQIPWGGWGGLASLADPAALDFSRVRPNTFQTMMPMSGVTAQSPISGDVWAGGQPVPDLNQFVRPMGAEEGWEGFSPTGAKPFEVDQSGWENYLTGKYGPASGRRVMPGDVDRSEPGTAGVKSQDLMQYGEMGPWGVTIDPSRYYENKTDIFANKHLGAFLGAAGAMLGATGGLGELFGNSLPTVSGGGAGSAAGGGSWLPSAITAAADPIEAISHALTATGAGTATQAATALGFPSMEAFLGSINPAWVTAGGALGASQGGNMNIYDLTAQDFVPGSFDGPSPFSVADSLQGAIGQTNLAEALGYLQNTGANTVGGGNGLLNMLKKAAGMSGNGSSGQGSLLSSLLPAGLGAVGSYLQGQNLSNLADKYMALGAPYRDRLSSMYSSPSSFYDNPDFRAAMDATVQSGMRKYAGTGRPLEEAVAQFGVPFAWDARNREITNLGGLGFNTAFGAGVDLSKAGTQTLPNILNSVGYGVNQFLNPQPDLSNALSKLILNFGNLPT